MIYDVRMRRADAALFCHGGKWPLIAQHPMAQLLKSTMRLRPDRIIVGEVRDGAALTLLKAWNTGHPGGVATIHSNTAQSALRRLEQLTAEVSTQPVQAVIGEAVDLIISIDRTPKGRRIGDILRVHVAEENPVALAKAIVNFLTK